MHWPPIFTSPCGQWSTCKSCNDVTFARGCFARAICFISFFFFFIREFTNRERNRRQKVDGFVRACFASVDRNITDPRYGFCRKPLVICVRSTTPNVNFHSFDSLEILSGANRCSGAQSYGNDLCVDHRRSRGGGEKGVQVSRRRCSPVKQDSLA